MTILKALKKINTLTKCELEHCIQRMNTEIEGYKLCSENDRPEIVAKYGIPYVMRLEERRQKFIDRLKQL
jgi:hypothetical protein